MRYENCTVTTAEIEQDIAETEAEIATMEREADFFESTPQSVAQTKPQSHRPRYLLGPNGRGEYVCHLPQKGTR